MKRRWNKAYFSSILFVVTAASVIFRFLSSRSIKMFVEDVYSGSGYEQCSKVISIGVLGFNMCRDTNYFHSVFQLRERTRNTIYSDKLEFHVVELKKLVKCSPKVKDRMLYQHHNEIKGEQ